MRYCSRQNMIILALVLLILSHSNVLLKIETITDKRTNQAVEICNCYIQALANNDWQGAAQYLSGEALLLHKKNTVNLGSVGKAVFNGLKTSKIMILGDYILLEARSSTSQGNSHLEEQNLRYYLVNLNGWKIYKTENLTEDFLAGIDKTEMQQAEFVLKSVLLKICAGEWDKALVDMTGQARAEAERTLALGQKPLLTQIENLQVEPIAVNGHSAWFVVRYETQASKMQMELQLQKILGQWKVSNTSIIYLSTTGVSG